MTEQKSRLVVEIDSRNSKKVAQELNKELKNLESSGDIASKGVTKVGEAAESQTPKLNQMKIGITKLAQEVKLGFAGMAGTIVGTIGSSLTIGAIAALAVQTANTAAEIERLAYLSGTTTTEFQEWAVGARAMGIEMDKLSDIFKDTRDRVGDFISTGGGELADFFTEIATKTEGGAKGALELAKAMRELSGPQALQLYVDKLKEAGVSQNEMVYYMESVADEATSLIPLLENGGEGFQLWAEAARNAGAIMDDETLAAAQRLKVETELLQMQINGLKNQFMQALLPALNQIAGAFLATSEQGVQFNGVSESVANTLIWLSKVGMGVAATFDIIGKTIGGAIAAMSDKNITHQMVLDDLGKTVDNWGTKFNKLNDPSSSNKLVDSLTKVQLRANQANKATAASAVNTSKMKETFDKAAGSSKKVADNTERLRREAERAAEEVRRIVYEYSTGEDKKRLDLEKEISHLRKYGMEQYVALAQARHQEEAKLIKMKFEYDLVEHRLTEEQKLRFSSNIKEQEIKADAELTKEQRNLKLDSLNDQFNQELGLIKLAKEQRIFQAEQAMMTEIQRVQKRYQLEREEIIKTANLDVEERTRRLNALNENTIRGGVGKNFSDPDDQSSQFLQSVQYSPVAKTNVQRLDEENAMVLQKLKDNLSAVKEAENASHEERLEAERVFRDAKQQLEDEYYFKAQDARRMDYENQLSMYNSMISMTGGVFGELMGIVSQYKDENTKTYKTMFAFQKAAALAQAIVSTELAATQVMSDPTALTMAQKMLYAGVIRATGYASAGIIAAQAFMGPGGEGYANGGYTGHGGKYDPAGIVHKGEGVLTQEEVKALGGPQGFEDLRKSIRRGYSAGGLVADTHRVGMGAINAINNGGSIQAEKQAQANVKAGGAGQQSQAPQFTIINQIEQDDLVGNYMRGAAGGQILLNQIKANPSEFKRALGV